MAGDFYTGYFWIKSPAREAGAANAYKFFDSLKVFGEF